MSLFIVNGLLHLEQGSKRGFIQITDGKIEVVGRMDELPDLAGHEVIHLTENQGILPGMIDVHIHGVGGADVMDATPQALRTMAELLPQEGTTSFLATTMTQAPAKIEAALSNAAAYITQQQPGTAECLGIHLEGPFISPKRANAQPLEHIKQPNVEQFARFQQVAQNRIKLVTMAPEEENGYEFVAHLAKSGVICSIGHSDATYAQATAAIEHGASHITHLFNAMTGLHHRDPGVAGAAMLRKELMVELIADGIHVSEDMIRLVLDQITSERLILITDSMRAKCLKNGVYELGGQQVNVQDGQAKLEGGTLAGSILKMKDALKNMHSFTGASFQDLLRMGSLNAAKELSVDDRKGSIAVGKDADLVIINEANEIEMTFCLGMIAYERGKQHENRESKRL